MPSRLSRIIERGGARKKRITRLVRVQTKHQTSSTSEAIFPVHRRRLEVEPGKTVNSPFQIKRLRRRTPSSDRLRILNDIPRKAEDATKCLLRRLTFAAVSDVLRFVGQSVALADDT